MPLRERDTTIRKTYFRNHQMYGRTTTLIEKSTGKVLYVGLGSWSRRILFTAWSEKQEN